MEKIYIKREKNVFLPENMLLGVGIFPAHATRDDESIFYGLTIEEANKLKELIPEGMITGDAAIFSSRQFKFPCQLPSGMMMYAEGTVEFWVEYASKRISITIPTSEPKGGKERKKLNTERLPLNVLGDIREYEGAIDAKDTSKDEKINAMSRDRLLRNFLEWNGLINFDYKIKNAVEHIFRVKLDD